MTGRTPSRSRISTATPTAAAAAMLLNLTLLGSASLAIGTFASTLARNQLVAGFLALVMIIVMLILYQFSQALDGAVREVFVRLYEKGLIYRGEYMVNWCPRCLTAISDLEVTHEDVQGHLWNIRYPVNGMDRYLVVATTRPETMLGDTITIR